MGMFLFIVLLIALWQGVYWFGVEVFAVFKATSVMIGLELDHISFGLM